jgi:hypothetical protein
VGDKLAFNSVLLARLMIVLDECTIHLLLVGILCSPHRILHKAAHFIAVGIGTFSLLL